MGVQVINVTFDRGQGTDELRFLGADDEVHELLETLRNTIDALDSLHTVTGILRFNDNPLLESLEGLNHVTAAYLLEIHGNAALSDLAALSSLVTLEDELYIRDNDLLTSVSGLSSLESVDSDISIYQNDGLCDADVDELLALTYYGGSYKVDNDGPCD